MKKILCVEDHVKVRELVAITLGDHYHILQADSAEEGIKLAIKNKPDLIILDVMLKGELNGLDAAKLIKRNPNLRDCHILMLSAKGEEIDIRAGLDSGADDYIAKPFSPTHLVERVESILEK